MRRLRIYPHALREPNAYYSPDKKALLFGYFPATATDRLNTPGTIVFTCLSHDIVAHETTHALLDGMHPRFKEATNPDVLAFHEAFADIVALFQHFSYPEVLRHQIAHTSGDLERESLLGQLAQQFGRATGRGSALRDALGEEVDGVWKRRAAGCDDLEQVREPHGRGAILVAAVFGAFLLVYGKRTADLFRIATRARAGCRMERSTRTSSVGSPTRPRSARSDVLNMCIRALDYCPPVDLTFGDYLRALITADLNLSPDDDLGYRVAFIESFREWGIAPRGIRSMSVEALLLADRSDDHRGHAILAGGGRLGLGRPSTRSGHAGAGGRPGRTRNEHGGHPGAVRALAGGPGRRPRQQSRFHRWDLSSDRYQVWKNMDESRQAFWRWLVRGGPGILRGVRARARRRSAENRLSPARQAGPRGALGPRAPNSG